MFRALFTAGLCALGAFLSTAPAYAADPAPTSERVQLLGGIRYGSDDLNFGLGARGGYTLPNNVYLGGTFDYFFGDSEESGFAGARVEASASLWLLGAEGGYDFGVSDNVVIRPFGGLGFAQANAEVCTELAGLPRQCADGSEDDVAITLGGLLHYVSGSLLVGPELRLVIVEDAALIVGGHVGAQF